MADVRLADNLSHLHLFPLILQSQRTPLLPQYIYCRVNYHNPPHSGNGSSSRQEWDELLGGSGLQDLSWSNRQLQRGCLFMALFKPAKKRLNRNRTCGPSSEDVEGSALHNRERLGCPVKTRRSLCCKAMAELRYTEPISSSRAGWWSVKVFTHS